MFGQLKSGGKPTDMQPKATMSLPDEEGPLYRRIANALMAGMREGRFPVGSLLPGELELIELFSASRHTVREALRVLEDMGLVRRQRGRGTLVLSVDARPAFVQMVRSPSELFSYPGDSSFRVLGDSKIRVSGALSRRLKCASGTEWACISGLRTLEGNGMPICWSDVYVIPEYQSIVKQLGRSSRPVYELLAAAFGEQVHNIGVEIYASVVADERAAALNVEPGTPSLCVCRRYRGNNDRIFEVSISEHPAPNFTYSFEFDRGWQSSEHWSWSQ